MDPFFAWLAVQLAPLQAHHWLVLAGVLLAVQLAARLGMWAYALFTLPGTVAHESSHYLVAATLGAKPDFPSLVPQKIGRSWRLGSVRFRAGMVRSVPIALAPLVLAPIGLAYAVFFLAPADQPALIALHAWVAGTLLASSLPSRADWAIALPALLVVGIAVLVLWMIW